VALATPKERRLARRPPAVKVAAPVVGAEALAEVAAAVAA
jgi:hypothetical protein